MRRRCLARCCAYVARRVTIAQCRQGRAWSRLPDRWRTRTAATASPPRWTSCRRACPRTASSRATAHFRQRHGIRAGRPMALFVGRVAHEKNIDFLLQMWPQVLARVPEALLVIAGGPAVAHCHPPRAGARAAAVGAVPRYLERGSELSDCYRSAGVISCSPRAPRRRGLVLLEAMAQARPRCPRRSWARRTCCAMRAAPWSCRRSLLRSPPLSLTFCRIARVATLSGQARDDAARWSDRAMARRLIGSSTRR